MTDEEVQQQHPLVALLRSLLPWVDMGQQPDYAAGEGGAEGRDGGEQQQPDGAQQ